MVNGQTVVDHWNQSEPEEIQQQAPLVAGEYYDLEIELKNTNGPIRAKLEWSSASVPRAVVPSDHLFPPGLLPTVANPRPTSKPLPA